jgi:hypothetical protein
VGTNQPGFPFKDTKQSAKRLGFAAPQPLDLILGRKEGTVKQSLLKTVLWLVVLSLAACAPVATATPARDILPSTQLTQDVQYHPLNTLTNVPEIDVIIGAVAGSDPQELRNLFEYTKTACMTVHALGGPPPCRENEAEGTVVEVLPSLGPEGSFLRKDEAENFPALEVKGLYAIYRVPEAAFSDPNYPAGDHTIVYVGEGNNPDIVLQVTNGKIVRIDYILGYPESNELLPKGVSDFLLEPVSQ